MDQQLEGGERENQDFWIQYQVWRGVFLVVINPSASIPVPQHLPVLSVPIPHQLLLLSIPVTRLPSNSYTVLYCPCSPQALKFLYQSHPLPIPIPLLMPLSLILLLSQHPPMSSCPRSLNPMFLTSLHSSQATCSVSPTPAVESLEQRNSILVPNTTKKPW